MPSRRPDPRSYNSPRDLAVTDEEGKPCSRIPPELCDGARLVTQDDGTVLRQPARTPRAFCDPCRSRIVTCLDELPVAYLKLGAALGVRPRTGRAVRAPFGPSEPVRGEIDALMRVMAVIVHGWEARVRGSRLGLASRDIGDPGDPASVARACQTLRKHPDVLLALDYGWMTRTYTFPPGKPGGGWGEEGTCRHCGRRISRSRVSGLWWPVDRAADTPPCGDVWAHEPIGVTAPAEQSAIPEEIRVRAGSHEDVVSVAGHEIVRSGDGWVTVMGWVDGAVAGNEILDLHWRARRHLGETKAPPDALDGIPCRSCDAFTLVRAEPPSDPSLPANESHCHACKDEMSRDELDQWVDLWTAWSRGAGIAVCRRCSLGKCPDCCWDRCTCENGTHPRRPAAA